jgi:hypothetical protein
MFSPTRDIPVHFFLSHFCIATAGSTLALDMAAHFESLLNCYCRFQFCLWHGCELYLEWMLDSGYSPAGDTDKPVSWVTAALLQLVSLSLAARINFVFWFTILNQQNGQTCSLDICIVISDFTPLHLSFRKGTSSGIQTKAIIHNTKLATFVHSWLAVKESTS